MEIRPAERADLPAVVALLAEDQLGAAREDPGPPLPVAYLRAFEEIEADPNNLLVVVEDGGEVIGTLQLTFIPYLSHGGSRRALVESVRVARPRRGTGVGEELMRWAESEAERRGCDLVQLTSDKVRGDAHRFYERLGYERSHEGFKRRIDA